MTSTRLLALAGICILGIVVLGMRGCPKYEVYQRNLKGQAELPRAEDTVAVPRRCPRATCFGGIARQLSDP
jgi:hypothetical protein